MNDYEGRGTKDEGRTRKSYVYRPSERSERTSIVHRKAVNMKLAILALLLCLISSPAYATDTDRFELEKPSINGYFKNLANVSKTVSTKERLISFMQRLRFEVKQKFTEEVSATVIYDNETIFHDFGDTADFDAIREKDQRRLALWDMDEVFIDEENFYWRHSLYRAYVQYFSPTFRCVIGKQGIDWSRMRFYHPFDLFNPISPLDIEKEEKVGVDAVNVEISPEPFMTFNFIYAPGTNKSKQGLGLRFSTKIHDYDLFLLAAEVKKDKIIGCGFDGYIKDAGFRGELTRTFKNDGDGYLRGSVGLDYSFTRKLYGIIEYFYNESADSENVGQFLSSYEFSRRQMSITKHILGAGLEYEFSGITKLNNYLFYDIEENSLFYNPEFKWNIKPNFDLSFGVQYFEGEDDSEYGNYHNAVYTEMKYFF